MSAALLSRVFDIPGILTTCTEFQDGTRFAEYPNGDIAAAEGHLSLLKIRRQLCRIVGTCGDKDPGARVQEGANVSGNVPGERQELVRYAEDLRYTQCAADWAATQGHLDVVKWLLENRQEGCTESAIDGACWNGHSETVEWLVNDWGQEISERALDYAASTGRLELVKWLTERGAKCTSVAMDGAAGDGHLEVVRWLGQNRREGCSRAAFEMAAAGGHLHVIEWLDEAGLLRCSSRGLDNAAEGGHLDVLKWMQEHKSEHQCTSNAYGLAAGTGKLEVLEWLRDTMPDLCCPTWASEIAANSGHLTVVKWLHETGLCRASFATLDDAAALGRLEAVVWLSEHGGRATEAAVDRAAEAGYADVVSYLLKNRQEGCSPNAIVEAARNGHLAVVKLLLQHGQEQFENYFLEAKSVAGDRGHDEVMRWLEEHDFNRVKDLEEALKSCTLGKYSTDASLALVNEAYNDNGKSSSGPERKSEAAGPRGAHEYVADDDPGRGLSEKRSGCASPIAGDFLVDEACHCSHDEVGTIDGDEVVPTRIRDGEMVGSDVQGAASLPGREGTSLTSTVRRVIAVLVSGFVYTLSSTDDRGRTPALSSGEREGGGGSI